LKTRDGCRTFLAGRDEERVTFQGAVRFTQVSCLRADCRVGRHGTLRIEGIVDREADDGQMDLRGSSVRLSSGGGGGEVPLFAGAVTGCEWKRQGGIWYLGLTAVSATRLLDQEERCRMFQDVSMTYGDIVREIAGEGRRIVMAEGADKRPGYPLFQYRETDWQFLKRIASTLGTVLVPGVADPSPRLSIGAVTGREHVLEDTGRHTVRADYKRAREREGDGIPPGALMRYEIRTAQDFRLGDTVLFRGKRWLILQKEMRLENGVLGSTYQLGSQQTWWEEIQDDRLCGTALSGRVLQAEGEKIKLHLDIDEREAPKIADMYAFDYVPVTGDILYAMPEPGAKVSLYFPGPGEAGGMVIDSVQERIVYPDHEEKVMELPSGIQMELAPDTILFSAKEKRAWMAIKDGRGIVLGSSERIGLSAGGRIQIAGGNVCIASKDQVVMTDGDMDSMEIKGRRVTFRSPRYRLSAVRHRTIQRERSMADYQVIRDLETVAYGVMGGIPVGELGGIEARIRAGIPAVLDAERPFMDGIAQISWRRG